MRIRNLISKERNGFPTPCSEESSHCELQIVPGDGPAQVGIVRIESVERPTVQVTATLHPCSHSVIGILCVAGCE